MPSTARPSPGQPDTAQSGEHEFQRYLEEAHVHLSRYFRAWLAGLPGGAALADLLAEEALVRLARAFTARKARTREEQVAAWLAVARDLARELVAG